MMEIELFKKYKNACIWDVCKCGKDCACETVKEFVESCKNYLINEGLTDTTTMWREISDCRTLSQIF